MAKKHGSLIDGSLTIGGDTTITRIQVRKSGAILSIGSSGPRSLATYFGPGGDGNDLTVFVQTANSKIQIPVAGNIAASGDDFIDFNVSVPSSGEAMLNCITAGERIIFAMARPLPSAHPGE